MEMMGLVVIIILATLAMLFVIQFVVLKEPTEIKKQYTHTQLAANTLNAMLISTTKDCKGQDLTQLLLDCSANHYSGGSIQCDTGQYSCIYSHDTIDGILDQTLVKWNKAFNFTVRMDGIDVIEPITNGKCVGERQTKIYPISNMLVRLDICG